MKKHIATFAALLMGLFFCGHCGAQAADGLRGYIAQPGDSFAILARRTGYDHELLAAINNMSPGYCCRGGETLLLPAENSIIRTAPASRNGTSPRSKNATTWQAPINGVITSAFAANRSASPHHGTDIAAPGGTPILAAHSGTVVLAGWQNSVYGYAVLIDHGNGWQTHYAHCSKVLVAAGNTVRQGQKIALVGSTGNSTGPHLHLELKKDEVYLNPARYFTDLSV